MRFVLNNEAQKQINECLSLLKNIFGKNLLGVYLYGSAIVGGLQKYSDIDLFVVLDRPTLLEEKARLVEDLLKISGVYMKNEKLPIEMTIVEKSGINPWRYPPQFDFQYGEWLREKFVSGIIDPGSNKEMPDLALLITQVLLASKTLFGLGPDQLLPKVPYNDFMMAMTHELKNLMPELNNDTRNVLLTYARIWSTLTTEAICSKPAAADWAIDHLPNEYRPVMKRAKAICIGKEKEHWDDMRPLIKPCADFIISHIHEQFFVIQQADNSKKSIKLAD